MAPLAPKMLKRKYEGVYQANKKFKKLSIYREPMTAPAPSRVEMKYDVGQVSGTVLVAGTVSLVSTIGQGPNYNERIGNRIKYYQMELSWLWDNATAAHGLDDGRMLVVYDNSPNGSLPAITDILANALPYAVRNPLTLNRFTIMFDTHAQLLLLQSDGCCWNNNVQGSKVISLRGKTACYTGTGNAIADIEKGAIYICTVSSGGNIGLVVQNRISYSDV